MWKSCAFLHVHFFARTKKVRYNLLLRITRNFISRLSMSGAFKLPNDFWSSLQVTPQDIENLHSFLFERETPLTLRDLTAE